MPNIPHEKVCRKCGVLKTSSGFYRDSHSPDGLNSFCKECNNAYPRTYDPTKKKLWIKRPITEKRREQYRESSRKWAAANPEKRAEVRSRRRAAIAGQQEHFTRDQWAALCAFYGQRCLCCHKAKQLTPDHIVPISRGGSNGIDNIQPLCFDCNRRKGSRTIDYR